MLARPAANPIAQAVPVDPRLHMRWYQENLGTQTFTIGGQVVSQQLDQAGALDMVIVHVQANLTVATAPLVFLPGMPWNLLSRIAVQPPGANAPVNLGGWSLHNWNSDLSDFAPFEDGTPGPAITPDANAYDAANIDVFPVAVGAQVWHLWYVVPFHRSSLDMTGILPLGNASRTVVQLTPTASKADIVTTTANLTADTYSATVYQCYWAVPDGVDISRWTNQAIWFDENQQAAILGDNKVVLDPNWTYLGLFHFLALNGAADSADVNKLYFRANKSDLTDQKGLDGLGHFFTQRRRHGKPFPTGIVFFDEDRFADAGPLERRAWIYTDRLQTFDTTINIPATATLGATPFIRTSTRRLVDKNQAGFYAGAG